MKKILSIALWLLLLFNSTAFAGSCGSADDLSGTTHFDGSSPYDADSASHEDVQYCVDSASEGDQINVPAGTVEWTSSVYWQNKSLKVIGAGTDEESGGTRININGTNGAFNSDVNGRALNASRISNFRIYGTVDGLTLVYISGQGWRIDHNKIEDHSGAQTYIYCDGANVGGTFDPQGLIDHNDLYMVRPYVSGAGSFNARSELWYQNSSVGAVDAVFFEYNTVYHENTASGVFSDIYSGGKMVYRYNTLTGEHDIFFHPINGSTDRGTRMMEIYGNTMSDPMYWPIFFRGGTGMIFGNYFHNLSQAISIRMDVQRVTTAKGSLLLCDGTHPWDGNELSNGYPCRDQVGRGKDSVLAVGDYTSLAAQALEPVYLWSNYQEGGTPVAMSIGNSTHLFSDKDYYAYAPSFDGSTGTGCGTLAAIPSATGLADGIGYWATDQSCTDLSSHVGVGATPYVGTLYVVQDEEWVAHYTPYGAHPLSEATSAASGTIFAGDMSESALVAGGRILSFTIFDDTLVAEGTFNTYRQNIIDSCLSASTTYTHGWNNEIVADEDPTAITWIDSTHFQWELTANTGYTIDAADGPISCSLPHQIFTNSTVNVTPTPAFYISNEDTIVGADFYYGAGAPELEYSSSGKEILSQ